MQVTLTSKDTSFTFVNDISVTRNGTSVDLDKASLDTVSAILAAIDDGRITSDTPRSTVLSKRGSLIAARDGTAVLDAASIDQDMLKQAVSGAVTSALTDEAVKNQIVSGVKTAAEEASTKALQAESKAAEAVSKITQAEQKASEASSKVDAAARKIEQAESKASQAEQKVAEATKSATEAKEAVRAIEDKVGSLPTLETSAKDSAVVAINEVKGLAKTASTKAAGLEEALNTLKLKVEALEKSGVKPATPVTPPSPVTPPPTPQPNPANPVTPANPSDSQSGLNKYIIRKDNGQKLYVSGPKLDESEITDYILANGDAQIDVEGNPKPGVEVFTE